MRRHKVLFINLNQVRILAKNLAVIILFLLSFFLLLMNKMSNKNMSEVSSASMQLLSPVIRVITVPAKGVYKIVTYFRDVTNVYSQNKELKAENLRLKKIQNRFKAVETENLLLGRLLNYSAPEDAKYITAQVISEDSTNFSNSVIAYLGNNHNVKIGQIALNETGVVGRIETVGGNYARIMLITDVNSKIPVIVERNRVRGILSGDNTASPKLMFTPFDVELEIGDVLVTSGVAGGFPAGLPIGTIYEIDDKQIKIQPLSDLNRLEYIQIVDYAADFESLKEDNR